MPREEQETTKQAMEVQILPGVVYARGIAIRLLPAESFPFARALLDNYGAYRFSFYHPQPLRGVEAYHLPDEYYNHAFFAKFNHAVAMDYLHRCELCLDDVARAKDYLQQTLHYLIKAVHEGCIEARFSLLQILNDVKYQQALQGLCQHNKSLQIYLLAFKDMVVDLQLLDKAYTDDMIAGDEQHARDKAEAENITGAVTSTRSRGSSTSSNESLRRAAMLAAQAATSVNGSPLASPAATPPVKRKGRPRRSSSSARLRGILQLTTGNFYNPSDVATRAHHLLLATDDVDGLSGSKFHGPQVRHIEDVFNVSYLGNGLAKSRKVAALLEVLAGIWARLIGGAEQPASYYKERPDGSLQVLVDRVKTERVNTHFNGRYDKSLSGVGRASGLSAVLLDDDPHSLNHLLTGVNGYPEVVRVDFDRALIPFMAVVKGDGAEARRQVTYLSEYDFLAKAGLTAVPQQDVYQLSEYDKDEQTVTVLCYVHQRGQYQQCVYSLNQTTEQLFGPYAQDVGSAPQDYKMRPVVSLYPHSSSGQAAAEAEKYNSNPRFRAEYLLTQLKSQASISLQLYLMQVVFDEYPLEQHLFKLQWLDLQQKRLQELLKSPSFIDFIKENYYQLGFVLVHEFQQFIVNNARHFQLDQSNILDAKLCTDALNTVVQYYADVLQQTGIDFSVEAYQNDLLQFANSFYNESITVESRIHECDYGKLQLESQVVKFYQKHSMHLDTKRVESVQAAIQARRNKLQRETNSTNPLAESLKASIAMYAEQLGRLNQFSLIMPFSPELHAFLHVDKEMNELMAHFAESHAIDWSEHQATVNKYASWLLHYKNAVDLCLLHHFAKEYMLRNLGTEKAAVVATLLPLMKEIARQLAGVSSESEESERLIARKNNLIQLYNFMLSCRRNPHWDSIRINLARAFGGKSSVEDGPNSLKEWHRAAGTVVNAKASQAAGEEQQQYHAGARLEVTATTRGEEEQQQAPLSVANNWASFYRTFAGNRAVTGHELLKAEALDRLHFRPASVACSA